MNINYLEPTKEQIISYLEGKGLETKDANGQIVANKCPFCNDNKVDWTHFYISPSNGMYKCHKCGERGNLVTLAKHFGDFEHKNLGTTSNNKLSMPVKSPEQLKKEPPKVLTEPEDDKLKLMGQSTEVYHEALIKGEKEKPNTLVKKVFDYLTIERGFTIDTLKHFKIGWTGQAISIPYLDKGKVVNIRFRKNPFDKSKKFAKMYSTPGGKMTLFNCDVIDKEKRIVITEGEFDAMSLYQQGWGNVLSISCGANTFKEEWGEMLKKQAKIYLCYDNDVVGNEGVNIAIDRLGAGRCYKITLPRNSQETKKDLNEFFAKDKKTIDDFHELFNKAEKVKVDYENIKHIKELSERVKEEMQYSGVLRGLSTGYTLLDQVWSGMRPGNLIVISGDTNIGKCHGKGTKILMYSGEVKKVEDIEINDELQGIDNNPRTVLSLARGREQMYKIIPNDGAEEFTVNKNHILSLKKNTKQYPHFKDFLEITVEDYINLAEKRKHVYKLWQPGLINYPKKGTALSSYFLGLWLGDGTSIYPCITTADKEIEDYLYEYAKTKKVKITKKIQPNNKSNYYCLRRHNGKEYNQITYLLREYKLIGNKHIPEVFKVNSEKKRLELLAGLIDSDGNKETAGYSFSNTNKKLCEDVIFIARSLGFFASTLKTRYTTCNGKKFKSYRVYISGDIERIPLKIKRKISDKRKGIQDWLSTGFKIEKLNRQNYYGFNLDKDQLYLLENFIVNHNSFFTQNMILNMARQDVTCLSISLEETVEETVERFLMLDDGFNYQEEKIKGEKEAIKKLDLAFEGLANNPIYMYSGYEQLTPKLLGEVVEKGVKDFGCQIAVIDHLHYFVGGDRRQRTLEIGDIVRYVKLLARKLNIPIILICHLRKLKEAGDVATLDDLKDSSSIKQDADIVGLLYRERDKTTRLMSSLVTVNTDKNRHGKLGKVDFIFGDGEIASTGVPLCTFEEVGFTDNEAKNANQAEVKTTKEQSNFKEVEETKLGV